MRFIFAPLFIFMQILQYINFRNVIISLFFVLTLNLSAQNLEEGLYSISQQIIESPSNDIKLIKNAELKEMIENHLMNDFKMIHSIDSNRLIYELISDDKNIQILTWAILFEKEWSYFGYIKSYNSIKKQFEVFELIPSDFYNSIHSNEICSPENWPAAIYYKIVETTYKDKKYYTLLGWTPQKDQTAYKIIDVINISKSGKVYFGKTKLFKIDKDYQKRIRFAYNYQSKFLLDYGEYRYQRRIWNKKKRKYEIEEYEENLIVFDHLIPLYPDLADMDEFMVPVGNSIDAFAFKKGKWTFISDIDARNLKQDNSSNNQPSLELFETKE